MSPRDDLIGPFHVRLALAHLLLLEDHERAVKLAQRAVRLRGTMWFGYAYLVAALAHLGRVEEAKNILQELLVVEPRASISFAEKQISILDADNMAHLVGGLRKAGLTE